jgi:hypothetical protein
MCRVSYGYLMCQTHGGVYKRGMHVSSRGFGMVREGGEIGVQKRGGGLRKLVFRISRGVTKRCRLSWLTDSALVL